MRSARLIVRIPALGRVLAPAQLVISIEDTRRQDAPAVVVARLQFDLDELDATEPAELILDCPLPAERRSYEVGAVLHLHRDGVLRQGDLTNVVAVTVRESAVAEVPLVRVPEP
ncbi:hypothetical protein ACFQE5_07665 [Pseudonocardia hispaniensis]|uniref:Type III secretion system (T3SS) chaperone YscW n=1 Tax=Pseudonocardia hispaniensis TaxID=904933 RepID=A0ABW1J0S8_9PSEU